MAYSVLIVDDSAVMRQALRRLFRAARGFEICGEARDGNEAIEMVHELKPELVVLDLCMPGINGLTTARLLRGINSPPIILYSMNAEDIADRDAHDSGVSAVVSKAEGMRSLIAKARRILNRSAA